MSQSPALLLSMKWGFNGHCGGGIHRALALLDGAGKSISGEKVLESKGKLGCTHPKSCLGQSLTTMPD